VNAFDSFYFANDKPTVLIPDGESRFALKVLRCLAEVPGLQVSALSKNPGAPIRFSRHLSRFVTRTADKSDEARLDAILQALKKLKADVVLPVDQGTFRLVATYRDEFESVAALPPIVTPNLIDMAGDKWLLTEILRKEKIPHPATVLLRPVEFKPGDLEGFSYPVLVKPRDSWGGAGIVFFMNQAELEQFLRNQENCADFIIQEFIWGYDLSCSVLCRNGEILAYTIQRGIIPGKKRFQPPAGIEFIHHEEVLNNVEKLMRALNWSGIANIDFRYDENAKQVKILELNPRYWQSLLGSLVAGVNFPYLAYLASLRIDFPRPEYRFVPFTYSGLLFGILLKKYLAGDQKVSDIRNTSLIFTMKDPVPELFRYPSKMFEKIYHRPYKNTSPTEAKVFNR
jgi:predicted ATP-grasp superfamily ATP-dependent carboligase